MKKNFYTIVRSFVLAAFVLISAQTFAQTSPKAEAAGASPAMYRQEVSLVKEADKSFYKTLVTFAKGKANKKSPKDIPQGVATKKCKIVMLFNKNAEWASPLVEGSMSVASEKLNNALTNHQLKIQKWFDVDNHKDGLVLAVKDEKSDLLAAAKELSEVPGVILVSINFPKNP